MLENCPMYAYIPARDVVACFLYDAAASGAKAAWFKDSEGNIMALIQQAG